MNSKSLEYDGTRSAILDAVTLKTASTFASIKKGLSEFFARYQIRQSQARYETKKQCRAQTQLYQNLLERLPLEEKHRLGMYHLM